VLPATESATQFVSHMASNNISHATIKTYLVAIRHMHMMAGMHTSFEEQLTLALKGVKRTQAMANPRRPRLRLWETNCVADSVAGSTPTHYSSAYVWH